MLLYLILYVLIFHFSISLFLVPRMPIDSTLPSPPLKLSLRVATSGVQGAGKGLFLSASIAPSSSEDNTMSTPTATVPIDDSHTPTTTLQFPHSQITATSTTLSSSSSIVVPKGTLLGWYGGRLLTPSEWVRKYAGGRGNKQDDSDAPNPADYTFHTPLGPLAWMCKDASAVKDSTGEDDTTVVSIRLVNDDNINISQNTKGSVSHNLNVTSPQSSVHGRVEEGVIPIANLTSIVDPNATVLGHYMNDVCGLVAALPPPLPPNHPAEDVDTQFKEMIQSHVTSAWGAGGGGGAHTTLINNAVVLKDMVFEVLHNITSPTSSSSSSFPAAMDVTHVCPVVAAVDIAIPLGGCVELTTSYGAPFWISRVVTSLFYNKPSPDEDEDDSIKLQQQQRGWRLGRWVREYVVESGVCADEGNVAALPCAVAIVMAHEKNDDVTQPTPPKPTLFICRTTSAAPSSFSQVDDCDRERLQHVLAALLNHDPAVYKLPAAAVSTLLVRLCPPPTPTPTNVVSPPLVIKGHTVIGTYFYSHSA